MYRYILQILNCNENCDDFRNNIKLISFKIFYFKTF